jgi:chromosomal replication initiator protein
MFSVKEIIKTIADFYDIPEASIYEKTRRKEVVKPRQIIMYILREDFKVSYPTIGEKLGGRDHTTVIHSCEKIKHDIKEDMQLFARRTQRSVEWIAELCSFGHYTWRLLFAIVKT